MKNTISTLLIAGLLLLSLFSFFELSDKQPDPLVAVEFTSGHDLINLDCPEDELKLQFRKIIERYNDQGLMTYDGKPFEAIIYLADHRIATVGNEIFENHGLLSLAHADLVSGFELTSGDFPLEIVIKNKEHFSFLQEGKRVKKLIQLRRNGESYLTRAKGKSDICCKYTCLDFADEAGLYVIDGFESKLNYNFVSSSEERGNEIVTNWKFKDIVYENHNGDFTIPAISKTYSEPVIFWNANLHYNLNNQNYSHPIKIDQTGMRNPRLKITEISYDVEVFKLSCEREDELVAVKKYTRPNYLDHFIDMNCGYQESVIGAL